MLWKILDAIHERNFEGECAGPVLLAGVATAVRARGSGQSSDVAVG